MKTESAQTSIDIGIEEKDREAVSQELSKLLADTYSLYLKTHNFHWNVTGPQFQALHTLFETQYNELALAVDEIAERIRALGFLAPATYSEFGRLTSIAEEDGSRNAESMVQSLIKAHETVVRTSRAVLRVADKAGDDVSVDLATTRMQVHEKTAWMLRSMLG